MQTRFKMMSKAILAGLFFLIPGSVFSQGTASVHGYVRDAETGETLIAANVALKNTRKGISTNTRGYYSLTNIEPGTYTLLVSYIGYDNYSENIELHAGEVLRVDVKLKPRDLHLEEIVVESEKEKQEQKNIGVVQMKAELIKSIPSAFESDVFRSVLHLPGIKASSDFSSGLHIRGGGLDQTLILLDQTTVYNPTHFFGFFSTFNPDAIKDVRLYKGGYPAKYGGRLGSVLSIFNKDGNRNEFSGTATIGLLASRAMIQGPFRKGSYMVAVRRSTLEPVLAVLRKTQDNIPQNFYFYDVNGKVNFDANRNNKLSLAFYSGKDNLKYSFADDARIKLNYGNQTISSNWTHIFSERVFSDVTVTGSRYFNLPSFTIATTPSDQKNNIYDFSVKGDIEIQPNDHHAISVGFWTGINTLKLTNSFNRKETFSSRIQSYYSSLYVQDSWDISEQWELTSGLRLNGFEEGNYWRLAPRASLEFRPTDRVRVQGAYGRYYQFLTLVTSESFSGLDTWFTASKGVKPSYGDQFVLGIKTIPWNNYGFDIELYYRTVNDLFDLNPLLPDLAGLDYPDLFRIGKGYAYGLEAMIEKQVGRLSGFIGYTFSISRNKYPGFNTPIGDSDDARYFPPNFNRLHDLNVVLRYKLSERWETSLVFNYATGQPYTKPLGRTQAADFPLTSDPLDILVVDQINASRLPAYHRMDIGFTRFGTFLGRADAQWKFQLINVYSRRNVWFYNYDFDENPIETGKVTMLPLLPNISYTVNF